MLTRRGALALEVIRCTEVGTCAVPTDTDTALDGAAAPFRVGVLRVAPPACPAPAEPPSDPLRPAETDSAKQGLGGRVHSPDDNSPD